MSFKKGEIGSQEVTCGTSTNTIACDKKMTVQMMKTQIQSSE